MHIDLALGNQRLNVGVDKLDGILQRQDVFARRPVDVIDHGRQRGGLSAAR